MANPLILVQPDPFAGVGKDVAAYVPASRDPQLAAAKYVTPDANDDLTRNLATRVLQLAEVSRPLLGHTIKPDSFAAIQIITADGRVRPIRNMTTADRTTASTSATSDFSDFFGAPERDLAENLLGASIAGVAEYADVRGNEDPGSAVRDAAYNKKVQTAWTDWIASGIQEERAEKVQFHEAFGANYMIPYGQKPVVYSIAGKLYNTPDFPYLAQFRANWDDEFRATKLVEHNARAYLIIDDLIIEGYPLSKTISQRAETDGLVPFSMSFWATRVIDTNHGGKSADRFKDARLSVAAGYDMQSRANRMKEASGVLDKLGLGGPERDILSGDLIDTFPILSNVTFEAGGAATEELLLAAGVSPTIATQVGRSTQDLLAGIKRGAFAALQGPFARASFAQNAIAKATRAAGNLALLTLDEKLQASVGLRQGEVNRWFGYINSLLRAGFDGIDSIPGVELDEWLKMSLSYRSLQAVVNGLAYTAASQIETGSLPRPETMAAPGTNTYANSTPDFRDYQGGFGYRGVYT